MKRIASTLIAIVGLSACIDRPASQMQSSELAGPEKPVVATYYSDVSNDWVHGLLFPHAIAHKGGKTDDIFIELQGCGTEDPLAKANALINLPHDTPSMDLADHPRLSDLKWEAEHFKELGFDLEGSKLILPCSGSESNLASSVKLLIDMPQDKGSIAYLATGPRDIQQEAGYFISFPLACMGLRSAFDLDNRLDSFNFETDRRAPTDEESLGEITLSCGQASPTKPRNQSWELLMADDGNGLRVLALQFENEVLGIRKVNGGPADAYDPEALAKELGVKLIRQTSFETVNKRRVALDVCVNRKAASCSAKPEHRVIAPDSNGILRELEPKTLDFYESTTVYGELHHVWSPSSSLALSFEQCGAGSFPEVLGLRLNRSSQPQPEWFEDRKRARSVIGSKAAKSIACMRKDEHTICRKTLDTSTIAKRETLLSATDCKPTATSIEYNVAEDLQIPATLPLRFDAAAFGSGIQQIMLKGPVDPTSTLRKTIEQSRNCPSCRGVFPLIEVTGPIRLHIRDLNLRAMGSPDRQLLSTAVSATESTITLKNVAVDAAKDKKKFTEGLKLENATAYIYDSTIEAEKHAIHAISSRFTVDSLPTGTKLSQLGISPDASELDSTANSQAYSVMQLRGPSKAVVGRGIFSGPIVVGLAGPTVFDFLGTQFRPDNQSKHPVAFREDFGPSTGVASRIDLRGFRQICWIKPFQSRSRINFLLETLDQNATFDQGGSRDVCVFSQGGML